MVFWEGSHGTRTITPTNAWQVKIRGFRVELGEIEMTMRKYDRKALIEPASRGWGGVYSHAEPPEEQILAECLWEIFPARQLVLEQTFSEANGDSLGGDPVNNLTNRKTFYLRHN
jgi:hypothetical protein